MFPRLVLAIVLLASHTLTLRVALGAQSHQPTPAVEFEPCCPLCVPADDGTSSAGCGCGCGTVEQDHRVPTSPSELPAIVQTQLALPAPEPRAIRTIDADRPGAGRVASISDDAPGHTDTHRFLARVGVWLN